MEALAIYTGAPTVHWEDNTGCISAVEDKGVKSRVKHIDITVCFIQEQFYNIFFPKYENSSFMSADMCTKTCSGPIISLSTKWTTGFIFYTDSDTKHHQRVKLHGFYVT